MNEGHCRICGSFKLNKLYYVQNIGKKAGIEEILAHRDSLNQLIRPCECRGQFAYTHRLCLENWIETTKHQYCDVCRFKYNIRYHERTFFDWIFETEQLENFLKAVAGIIFVYYISALGLLLYMKSRRKCILDTLVVSNSWIWMITTTIFTCWYIRHIAVEFSNWKENNRKVFVDGNKSPKLDAQYTQVDVLRSSGFNPKVREN